MLGLWGKVGGKLLLFIVPFGVGVEVVWVGDARRVTDGTGDALMEGGARPGLLPTYLPLGRVDKVSWPPRVRPPRYEVHTHPSYVGRCLTIGYTPTTRYLGTAAALSQRRTVEGEGRRDGGVRGGSQGARGLNLMGRATWKFLPPPSARKVCTHEPLPSRPDLPRAFVASAPSQTPNHFRLTSGLTTVMHLAHPRTSRR